VEWLKVQTLSSSPRKKKKKRKKEKENKRSWSPIAHGHNPSYPGSRDQED
jgi:hypothetical protein